MAIVKKIIDIYEKNPETISKRLIDHLTRNEAMLRGLLSTIHEMKVRSITSDGKVNIFTDKKIPGSSVHAIYPLLAMNEDALRRIANDILNE